MSRAAREYFELLTAELADAEATGAVALAGHVDDVPAALTQIGVILSSSLQESLHCSLVEGAASGAIPVVRDWPYFAGRRHSARTLFPSDWVVDTPQQAAARILELTQREDVWRAAGAAAATTAIQTWDWQVVSRKFEELIPTVSTSGAVDAIVEGSADLDPESDAASATSNWGADRPGRAGIDAVRSIRLPADHHRPERTGATVIIGATVDARADSLRFVMFVDNDARANSARARLGRCPSRSSGRRGQPSLGGRPCSPEHGRTPPVVRLSVGACCQG